MDQALWEDMKDWRGFVIILLLIAIAILAATRPRVTVKTERYTDTVLLRDTIEVEIEKPIYRYVDRLDTVLLQTTDTVKVEVLLPIERKEYKGRDYHAVIEGYKAELISLKVFPTTTRITETKIKTITKRQRWGLGIQAGYGITPDRIEPYIGIGISYNLLSW